MTKIPKWFKNENYERLKKKEFVKANWANHSTDRHEMIRAWVITSTRQYLSQKAMPIN